MYRKLKRGIYQKRFNKAMALKPAGPWSKDLLAGDSGKVLVSRHMLNVAKALKTAKKPKTKAELVKLLENAMMTPEQKLVVFYELSLTRPLSVEEFCTYMGLFKEVFPKAYEGIYGKKTPEEIASECCGIKPLKRDSVFKKDY